MSSGLILIKIGITECEQSARLVHVQRRSGSHDTT
jgi:hypothetical protein